MSAMKTHSIVSTAFTVCWALVIGGLSAFAASNLSAPSGTNMTNVQATNTTTSRGTNQIAGTSTQSGSASAGSNNCWISGFMDSNLASAIIGLLGGAVGFVIARRVDKTAKREEEDSKYCNLLDSVANELDFYADKFGFLSGQLGDFIRGSGIVPSYMFYPALLEQGKMRMNEFMRDAALVKEVGHCHFELNHICERLTLFKKQCEDIAGIGSPLQANAQGFKGLVDSNIPVFKNAAKALREATQRVRASS